MSVNSINIAMAGSYGAYSQKLTAATRNKLIELGINFNDDITEQEGKKMVQQAELQRMQQSQKTENEQSENNFSNQNQQQNNLFEQAKRLAEKLGIVVSVDEDFKKLLSKIEQALEKQIQSAQNNPSKLQQLRSLSSELASIEAQSEGSTGYDNTNKALMMSLEMLSQYNKSMINY